MKIINAEFFWHSDVIVGALDMQSEVADSTPGYSTFM